jgi:polysaccharide export outer membrane protein
MKKITPAIFLLLMIFSAASVAEYMIGPGDVLSVTVWGEDDISGKFMVSNTGTIYHFLLGEVKVAGKTVDEVRKMVSEALSKDYLKNPRVKVAVEEYHSYKVFILGEVARPGSFELKEKSRLLDVILLAGGPTQNAGDEISILRTVKENGEDKLKQESVSISKLFSEGKMDQNLDLVDRDVIYISRSISGVTSRIGDKNLNVYYVVGEVKKPGAFEYKAGYTVLNALLEAGGFTELAAPNSTKIIRGDGLKKEVLKVKLGDVVEKGEKDKDVLLKQGDMIIVPESWF